MIAAAQELGATWLGEDLLRNDDHLASLQGEAHWFWPHFVEVVAPNRNEVIQMVLLEHWSSEAIALRINAINALGEHWPDADARQLLRMRANADEHHAVRSTALEALAEKWPGATTRALLELRAVLDEVDWMKNEAKRPLERLKAAEQ